MEVSFALITEGITDQVTIAAILKGHYKGIDPQIEVIVNFLQPTRDATDATRQGGAAGWEKVLDACADPRMHAAIAFNDYLVIQIDTDAGEERNFGLPLTAGGVDIDDASLIAAAGQIISGRFGAAWPNHSATTVLAISVHSLECWLLALHTRPSPCATKNCEERLARHLRHPVAKTHRSYEDLSKDFRKPRELQAAATRSVSLAAFLQNLPLPPFP